MPLSQAQWHKRFQIQAQWTEGLRLYFFDLIKNDNITRVLDIGCGTGALLQDLNSLSPGRIFGADLNQGHLNLAKETSPDSDLVVADVHQLPYCDSSFNIVLSHFFFLWVGDPQHALKEIIRITKPGGVVVAFAEPDYGGRIDHPPDFSSIREYQISALQEAGADPRMGRKLPGLFAEVGLSDIVSGAYQGSWSGKLSQAEIESEWMVLDSDLSGFLTTEELQKLRKLDLASRNLGTRLVYVPTFYAWGKVSK